MMSTSNSRVLDQSSLKQRRRHENKLMHKQYCWLSGLVSRNDCTFDQQWVSFLILPYSKQICAPPPPPTLFLTVWRYLRTNDQCELLFHDGLTSSLSNSWIRSHSDGDTSTETKAQRRTVEYAHTKNIFRQLPHAEAGMHSEHKYLLLSAHMREWQRVTWPQKETPVHPRPRWVCEWRSESGTERDASLQMESRTPSPCVDVFVCRFIYLSVVLTAASVCVCVSPCAGKWRAPESAGMCTWVCFTSCLPHTEDIGCVQL